MPDVTVTVKTIDQGSANIKQYGGALDGLVGKALKVGAGLGALGLAFKGIEHSVKAAWGVLSDGAALELANSRFENLAASIGTTADVLKGQMADATQGMMSNAQMVASASNIISLGMADTGSEVVRLSNLVGQLGWDMNVLTLTMANDSMLRLDALGLSMTDVKERMEEFKKAGMEATDAFDLAVIEAGEAKLQLLGSAAETSAGKMQRAEVAITNYTDALKVQAIQLADNIGLIDGLANQAQRLNLFIEVTNKLQEALDAGAITSREWNVLNNNVRRGGVEYLQDVLEDLDRALLGNGATWQSWATSAAIAQAESANVAANFQAATGKVSEWTDEAKKAAIEAANLGGELAGLDLASVAGATQSGIWAAAGAHIQAMIDEANQEAIDKAQEAAEAMATAYEEAAVRMGHAFSDALKPEGGYDFGDTDAMDDAAWSMAQAFGLTVEELGNVGIAMGEITPEMADAAAKAVLFQEAFGLLLGQLGAGNLDTEGFVAAYDALIADLQDKSFIEIQVELKQKENPARDSWAWLPKEEREPIDIPVTFTPEEAALKTAIGMMDGIPDEQTKLIKFDAEYGGVTPAATTAIQTAIEAIDAKVLMEPEAAAVYETIELLDESRLTVYVDFVQGSTPELPDGKATGGSVYGGEAYVIGERGPELFVPWTSGNIVPNNRIGGGGEDMQLSVQNYFYGPTTAADVERATDTSARRMMERLQQVMSI